MTLTMQWWWHFCELAVGIYEERVLILARGDLENYLWVWQTEQQSKMPNIPITKYSCALKHKGWSGIGHSKSILEAPGKPWRQQMGGSKLAFHRLKEIFPDLVEETLLIQRTTTQKIQACLPQGTTNTGPSLLGMALMGKKYIQENQKSLNHNCKT